MNLYIILSVSQPGESTISGGNVFGVVLALFLLGYLIYSLIKPEKF